MKYKDFVSNNVGNYLRTIQRQMNNVRTEKSVFAVHQTRVNSRRLNNMLAINKSVFAKKKLKKWKKEITDLGNMFSEARDLDVHIQFLQDYSGRLRSQVQKDQVKKIQTHLRDRRQEIQPYLKEDIEEFKNRNVFQNIQDELTGLTISEKKDREKQIYKAAYKRLANCIRELLSFEEYVEQPDRVEELHGMRIAAKHLRYTLESLEKMYGEDMHDFYEQVLFFHRELGMVHDYDVWIQELEEVKKKTKSESIAAIAALEKYCQRQRDVSYKKFVSVWKRSNQNRLFEELLEYALAHQF